MSIITNSGAGSSFINHRVKITSCPFGGHTGMTGYVTGHHDTTGDAIVTIDRTYAVDEKCTPDRFVIIPTDTGEPKGEPNDLDAQAMAGFIMQACDSATRMAIEMRSEPVMNGTWEEFADAILQWQTEKYEAFLEGHRH